MKQVSITCANRAQAEAFLRGKKFCITGTLPVERKHYEDYIRQYGGTVMKKVTAETDYLIAAFNLTSETKYTAAYFLGNKIINYPEFHQLSGFSYHLEYVKPVRNRRNQHAYYTEAIPGHIRTAPVSLSGMIFCITGNLEHSRKQYVYFIRKNGGQVRSTMTADVNCLLMGYGSTRHTTRKLQEAFDRGLKIMTHNVLLKHTQVDSLLIQ